MCYTLTVAEIRIPVPCDILSTELTLLLRGVAIPENEVLDKEDLNLVHSLL